MEKRVHVFEEEHQGVFAIPLDDQRDVLVSGRTAAGDKLSLRTNTEQANGILLVEAMAGSFAEGDRLIISG